LTSSIVPEARAQASDLFVAPLWLPDRTGIELTLAAEPNIRDCVLNASEERRMSWTCSDYSLAIGIQDSGDGYLVEFDLRRLNDARFQLRRYGARASVVQRPGDGIWSSNHLPWRGMRDTTPISQPFEVDTSANRGIPFAVVVDSAGRNRLALGLVNQGYYAELRGDLDQDAGMYTLAVTETDAIDSARQREAFYVSSLARTWFEVSRDYTRAVDLARSYVPLPSPPHVSNPTYDPWYWMQDRIDATTTLDLARRTRDLGFQSYLIDAGWDIPAGEYSLFLDGTTGDYSPPVDTFPDFAGLLGRIRSELGMKVMLWMQQYALGRRSVYYTELSGSLSYAVDPGTGEVAETAALCPRVPSTRSHMARLFQRVIGDYRPDALWFDWQENIPAECNAEHAHAAGFAEGYAATQQEIRDSVLRVNPDMLFEMRWPFANLYNKPYVQLWQPIDTPGDFETMRLQAMAMRAFSSGVLIGTDSMYWDPSVSDEEAARFMATVVFTGVPYFGPDLTGESETRTEMLKAWLGFYQKYRGDLTEGDFRPYGDQNHPDQLIESGTTAFVYYGHHSTQAAHLDSGNERIYVVNASAATGIDLRIEGLNPGVYDAEISDTLLRPASPTLPIRLHGNDRLRCPVPVGCLLTLTRRNAG
jgi:hypothetical protein